jgi:hypothetical protein
MVSASARDDATQKETLRDVLREYFPNNWMEVEATL